MTAPALHADAALVVIDVQQGFDDAAYWGPRDNPECERNIGRLLAHWEATSRPIVLVWHDSVRADSPLRPGSAGNALKDVVAAAPPDLYVTKQVNSAFYGQPDLHGWLTGRGITQLVITGIQTNQCAETTARMAGNLGYDVLFALDATHTFDLAGPDGEVIPAARLAHTTAVNLHGGGFARVVRTNRILAMADAAQPVESREHA